MYYYAQLNTVTRVVELVFETEDEIVSNDYIQLNSLDTSLVGKWYNDETQTFQDPPAHLLAEMSTDDICYKQEDVWLNDVLDGKAEDNHTHTEYAPVVHTHSNYATTAALNDLQTQVNNLSTGGDIDLSGYVTDGELTTALTGKANTTHSHTEYAPVEHTHSQYALASDMTTALSGKSDSSHTHADYVTTTNLTTALSGKSDSTHNHDTDYADIEHTHSQYATTSSVSTSLEGKADVSHAHTNYVTTIAMNTALSSKSDTSHTHSDYVTSSEFTTALNNKSDISHTHTEYATVEALNGKSDTTHNHNEAYSAINHTHTEYPTFLNMYTALEDYAEDNHTHSDYVTETEMNTALSGKSNSDHTHSNYATITALDGKSDSNHTHTEYASATHNHDTDYSDINHTHSDYVTTTAMNSALANKSDTGHTHTGYAATSHTHTEYVTNTALETSLNGKADSSHIHTDYVTTANLTTALSGKSNSDHTHSDYSLTSHNHDTAYASINHTHEATEHTHTGYVTVAQMNEAIADAIANISTPSIGYVQSGLIKHYDGIRNTLTGHSNTTTTWYDLTGNDHLIANNMSTDDVWESNCFDINEDGSKGWRSTSPTYNDSTLTNITFCCSFKNESTENNYFMMAYPLKDIIHIQVDSGYLYAGGIGDTWSNYAATELPTTGITHCAATYNLSTGEVKLYVNGVLMDTSIETPITTNLYLENGLFRLMCISWDSETTYYTLNGKMYSAMMYNRILTPSEITQNYQTSLNRFGG